MRIQTITIDNFYPDPMRVREFALSVGWHQPYQKDNGNIKTNTAQKADKTWLTTNKVDIAPTIFHSDKMISVLESVTGDDIDRQAWKERPTRWNGLFHVKTHDQFESCLDSDYNPHQHAGIHSHTIDNSNSTGADGWAGIIYLNPNAAPAAGLTTWRPKTVVEDSFWTIHFTHENFEKIDTIGNTFNRLILARGDIWHSGAAGWGDSLSTGRMFQTFFFRSLGPSKVKKDFKLTSDDLPQPKKPELSVVSKSI